MGCIRLNTKNVYTFLFSSSLKILKLISFPFDLCLYINTLHLTEYPLLYQIKTFLVCFAHCSVCANSSAAQRSGSWAALGLMFAYFFTFLPFLSASVSLLAIRFIGIIFYLHFNAQFPARFGSIFWPRLAEAIIYTKMNICALVYSHGSDFNTLTPHPSRSIYLSLSLSVSLTLRNK